VDYGFRLARDGGRASAHCPINDAAIGRKTVFAADNSKQFFLRDLRRSAAASAVD
jgi:hypothetical protein